MEPRGCHGGVAAPHCRDGPGDWIVRADQFDGKRIDPKPFGLHITDQSNEAPIRRPRGPVLTDARRGQIEKPLTGLALFDPGRFRRGPFLLDQPVDESLPVLNLDVYQRTLIHKSTPCFLSVMAS